MSDRKRTYTFKVECPIPDTKTGETRQMTTFVYDVQGIGNARRIWFAKYLKTARKNGLRGSKRELNESLALRITRQAKTTLLAK